MRALGATGMALSLRSFPAPSGAGQQAAGDAGGSGAMLTYVSVADVETGSPAYRAGLRRGDALVAVGGRPVATVGEAWKALRERPARGGLPSGAVRLEWVPRQSVLLGELVAEPVPVRPGELAVRVDFLPEESPARRAGLQPGDTIVRVGPWQVRGTRETWEAIAVAARQSLRNFRH